MYLQKKQRQVRRQEKKLGAFILDDIINGVFGVFSGWFGTNQAKRAQEALLRQQAAWGMAPFSPIPGIESSGSAFNPIPILIVGGVAIGALMIMRGGKQKQPIVLMRGR